MKHPRTIARKRRKQEFVDLFGGKCEHCGYDKCINALTFHHTDPETKEYEPIKAMYERSFDFALQELKKCVMLCANCHAEIHSKEYDSSYKIDFKELPWLIIECGHCGNGFETKSTKRKFCGPKCFSLSQRRCERPSKIELEKLIHENSWVAIGRMYTVSDNSVRKWARKYGIIV